MKYSRKIYKHIICHPVKPETLLVFYNEYLPFFNFTFLI